MFSSRQYESPGVSTSSIESQISYLTTLVQTLVVGESHQENRFLGPPQGTYEPYLNIYGSGWGDQPDFGYETEPPYFQDSQSWYDTPFEQESCLEEMLMQFQQETRASIQNMETQVSQLATSLRKLESLDKLPSQQEVNLTMDASAINVDIPGACHELLKEPRDRSRDLYGSHCQKQQPEPFVIPPPFPERLTYYKMKKKEEEEEDIIDMFLTQLAEAEAEVTIQPTVDSSQDKEGEQQPKTVMIPSPVPEMSKPWTSPAPNIVFPTSGYRLFSFILQVFVLELQELSHSTFMRKIQFEKDTKLPWQVWHQPRPPDLRILVGKG